LNVTDEEAMKPVPVIVGISGPDPAVADVGDSSLMDG
jgi:hypothetical protein